MKDQTLFSVWDGVYQSFSEAGGDLDVFDSDRWIEKQKSEVKHALQHLNNGNHVSKDYPLSIVVAMALEAQKDTLRILDFGGGMGIQYIELLTKVPESKSRVKYYIVEGQTTVDNLPSELRQYLNLTFFGTLEELKGTVDIVHVGSTLHYIEDWKSLLETLAHKFSPKYFVFSDLLAGDVLPFVSHQKYYDKYIPVWMTNIQEFMNCMHELKYHKMYQSYFQSNILGYENLPNFALPEDKRIQKTFNLIFNKNMKFYGKT